MYRVGILNNLKYKSTHKVNRICNNSNTALFVKVRDESGNICLSVFDCTYLPFVRPFWNLPNQRVNSSTIRLMVVLISE